MQWKPRVTVAIVCERDGRFLMVEEQTADGIRFNQPAGHLENGESLVDAAVRECREETGYRFTPAGLIGVYRWENRNAGDTYLRFSFFGSCDEHSDGPQDEDIIGFHWLSSSDIESIGNELRSPLVMLSLRDYLRGSRHPLDVLADLPAG